MLDKFWSHPQRIIQTNLQFQDTARIDPKELGATVLVFNVGGIYAWYQSDVPFHRPEHSAHDQLSQTHRQRLSGQTGPYRPPYQRRGQAVAERHDSTAQSPGDGTDP